MKSTLSLLLALCLILLAGCGSEAPQEIQTPQTTPAIRNTEARETQAPAPVPETEPPEPPFLPTDLETQSQLYNWGIPCIQDGRYYGNFYESHYHCFGYSDDGKQTFTKLLNEGTNYVGLLDGSLYYSLVACDSSGIYRANPDGSEPELLLSRPGSKLGDPVQYWDGFFYYQDIENNHQYMRISKDGGEPETVIARAVYYPVIHDGWVLYQDDPDTMSLHWFQLETGKDYKLNNTYSFTPFFDGEHIYYLACSNFEEGGSKNVFFIRRMDPDGKNDIQIGDLPAEVFITDGKYIYFTNPEDRNLWRMDLDGSNAALFMDPSQIPTNHYVKIMRLEQGQLIFHISMGSYNVGNYVLSLEDGTVVGHY